MILKIVVREFTFQLDLINIKMTGTVHSPVMLFQQTVITGEADIRVSVRHWHSGSRARAVGESHRIIHPYDYGVTVLGCFRPYVFRIPYSHCAIMCVHQLGSRRSVHLPTSLTERCPGATSFWLSAGEPGIGNARVVGHGLCFSIGFIAFVVFRL